MIASVSWIFTYEICWWYFFKLIKESFATGKWQSINMTIGSKLNSWMNYIPDSALTSTCRSDLCCSAIPASSGSLAIFVTSDSVAVHLSLISFFLKCSDLTSNRKPSTVACSPPGKIIGVRGTRKSERTYRGKK